MITAEQMTRAESELSIGSPYHEHKVRIAYEWFSAQRPTSKPHNEKIDLMSVIADWSCSEISQGDIEIAAYLHPEIRGAFPFYNIVPQLTFPQLSDYEVMLNLGIAIVVQDCCWKNIVFMKL